MPDSHRRRTENLDPTAIKVQFSPGVKEALADLDASVHFSEHFDGDARAILQDWLVRSPSVRDVFTALPLLAEATFEHIRVTGDDRARNAWRDLCSQMLENGFVLGKKGLER